MYRNMCTFAPDSDSVVGDEIAISDPADEIETSFSGGTMLSSLLCAAEVHLPY